MTLHLLLVVADQISHFPPTPETSLSRVSTILAFGKWPYSSLQSLVSA